MLNEARPFWPPLVPLTLLCTPVLPIMEGSCVMAWKIWSLFCCSMKSEARTVVGVGAFMPVFMIRDDDTVTDSTPVSCA